MNTTTKLWIGIGILILLSPLGLILPHYFKAGPAWGEGKIFPRFWNAPVPGYSFKSWEGKPLAGLSIVYIVSAVIGILVCAGIAFLLGKLLTKKN